MIQVVAINLKKRCLAAIEANHSSPYRILYVEVVLGHPIHIRRDWDPEISNVLETLINFNYLARSKANNRELVLSYAEMATFNSGTSRACYGLGEVKSDIKEAS